MPAETIVAGGGGAEGESGGEGDGAEARVAADVGGGGIGRVGTFAVVGALGMLEDGETW